jgi:Carboxypeptidase regulatory-like domain
MDSIQIPTVKSFLNHYLTGLACVLVLFTATLRAQQTSGSSVGTVTDNTGAVVAGAAVTLTNVDTGDHRTATTNAAGDYQFVNLLPGNYRIDVEASGFKHFIRTNVVVQVQGSTRVDAPLELGNVSETVEVSSQAPLVETQQATLGQMVAGRVVTELPLNGRNVFNLLALSPGVVPQGGTQASNAVSGMNGNGFSTGNYQISGGIPNTGAQFVDGGPINNGYINAIAYIPSQDSIQEFRVEGSAIGPEFGGTTNGVVTMVTKSGTNAFHGTAFDFLRNTVLNANNFFSNQAHLKRPVLIQNEFGGVIGGPIKKDRLFFFGSYEGIRAAIGTTTTYSVPTAAMEAGVITSSTPIKDPGQFDANGNFVPAPPGTVFPNNTIPQNRINPTSAAMFKWWAPPNGPGTLNNYSVNATTKPSLNQYIARLDWNASEKQRIFGRYTYHHSLNPSALPYGYLPNMSTGHNAVQQFVFGDSITLSQTNILDFRLSYFRDTSFTGATGIPFDLGFTGWPAATIAALGTNCCGPVIPRVAVSGLSVNGGGGQQIFVTEENYAISGSDTMILGRHTLRFGGEFRRAPNNYGQTNSTQVEAFGFTNAFTGNPFASYLLGLPQTTVNELAIIPASVTYYGGIYIGDSFQATNKLVLNGGIRWEYPGYWTERHDRQAVFLAGDANPLAGPTGLNLHGNVDLVNTPAYPHRTNLLPHYDLFSPRLGLAYRLTNSFVIRSGFSLLYAPTANLQQDAQPYQAAVNLAFTQINPTTVPINSFSNPFPTGVLEPVGRSPNYLSVINGQPVVTNVPKEPATYAEQWNLDIEKDLGHQTVFDIAYVGNHGVHQQLPAGLNDNGQGLDQLPDQYDSMGSALTTQVPNPFYGIITTGNLSGKTIPAGQLLRPYPQYFNLWNAANTAAGSNYNAMQTKIEKRFTQGGTVLGTYTWSKDMGTADTQTGFQEAVQPGEVQNWNNLQAEYGPLSYNVPHRFVAAYVYDLPIGKGKRFMGNSTGVVDKVVGGWGVDGITTYALGFPLIFTAQPTFLSQQFGAGQPRPNVVPGCQKKLSGSAVSRQHGWFNTSCFTAPSNYGFGDEPRTDSTLRTQGIANWDAAVRKSTAITEQVSLEFRAEAFNMWNRVQFGQPSALCCNNSTDKSNASFGVISSQLNLPRVIQFALRLNF